VGCPYDAASTKITGRAFMDFYCCLVVVVLGRIHIGFIWYVEQKNWAVKNRATETLMSWVLK
jgi:hypothetical protein